MRVKKVYSAGRADVYNMEVEGTHDFAVNNGVIVHNCYDMTRYVCMENPIAARENKPPKLAVYDPLDINTPSYDRYAWLQHN